MANVLIIDDDKMVCKTLFNVVSRAGHNATCTHTLKEGLQELFSNTFDVVFLDVYLPDGNGLGVLPKIRETTFPPEVIIMTGNGDPDGAELAIKNDAWDYVQKPSTIKDINLLLVRALQYHSEKKARKPLVALKRGGIVGSSQKMNACFDLLAQAANSEANVLITGKTGTGKELFARAIHDNSQRAEKNFVVVDCAALPGTLVESVLFGFEKSSFTGADKSKDGLIKQADGGTLFLDEVGELPLFVQKAFLRVLQERTFRPVGSKQELKSNFRLVAATNRDLAHMAKYGSFRDDLLYRIQSLNIELPPLREHPEDIKELVLHYTEKLCKSYCIGTKGISPDFFDALTAYNWPGNVRELFNVIERALTAARYDQTLFPNHLPHDIRIQVTHNALRTQVKWPVTIETEEGPLNAETSNISIGGAFIHCQTLPCLKETFRLTINPPNHQTVTVTAVAVWFNFNLPESEIVNRGMGVRFLEISNEDRQFILETVADHHPESQEKRNSFSNELAAEGISKEGSNTSGTLPEFREYREEMEKQYLQKLISFTGGNIKKACQLSGISQSRLYTLLKEHKLS